MTFTEQDKAKGHGTMAKARQAVPRREGESRTQWKDRIFDHLCNANFPGKLLQAKNGPGATCLPGTPFLPGPFSGPEHKNARFRPSENPTIKLTRLGRPRESPASAGEYSVRRGLIVLQA